MPITARPRDCSLRVIAAMSSCKTDPVRCAISPTITGDCRPKGSCKRTDSSAFATSSLPVSCDFKESCKTPPRWRTRFFQYPGCAACQARTRAALYSPRNSSSLPGFASQARWLAALLAFRHAAFTQVRCRPRLRASGSKNSPQCRHLQDPLECIALHPSPSRWAQHRSLRPSRLPRDRGRKTTHGRRCFSGESRKNIDRRRGDFLTARNR